MSDDLPDDPVDDLYPDSRYQVPPGIVTRLRPREVMRDRPMSGVVSHREGVSTPSPSAEKASLSVENFRSVTKNTLRGFCDVRLPFGKFSLLIKEVSVHEKNAKRWVTLPAKVRLGTDGHPQKDERGKAMYDSILQWGSREASDRFSAKVVELLTIKNLLS